MKKGIVCEVRREPRPLSVGWEEWDWRPGSACTGISYSLGYTLKQVSTLNDKPVELNRVQVYPTVAVAAHPPTNLGYSPKMANPDRGTLCQDASVQPFGTS